ncbi:hypothetical protein SDC9_152473 [bioreactor metagenome]|uniref:Uncharacterized protein n=1 Tax=bioreactor metagenome TaxID=1076179 RepID=A0A645EXJ9_9ZZZZ
MKLAKKKIELTMVERVHNAVLGVESATAVFSKTVEEIIVANEQLKNVVNDCEQVISEHQYLKDKSQKAIQENELLLQNIKKLVGGTN